jgi:hypothetical protein
MSPFTTVATVVKGSLHNNSPTKGIVKTTLVYIYLTHHYEEQISNKKNDWLNIQNNFSQYA